MTEIIQSLLTLVAASIPLLIAIIGYFTSRSEKTTALLDTSSLKILKVVREPVNEKVWKKKNRRFFSRVVLSSLLILLTYGVIFFITLILLKLSLLLNISIFFIMLATLIVFSLLVYYLIDLHFHTASYGRYYIFQNAYMLIEADYHYLFNKCLEVLRTMNLKVIEVDESIGHFEAFQGKRWVSKSRIIKSHIEQVDNSESSYRIWINFENLDNEDIDDLEHYSVVTNRFINRLISNPKDADEKKKS